MNGIDYVEMCKGLRSFQKPVNRYEELSKKLNPDELILIAQKTAALTDFGDDSFITPYKKLLESVAQDVNFSDEGLENFKHHIIRCLVNRLRIHDDFQHHPEIMEEDVSDPIVVIGFPRTGTTKMQRILSSLPGTDVQKTYLWQMMNPAPFPGAPANSPDPRIAAAEIGGLTSDDRPDYRAAHNTTALEPEEDGLMCDSTFDDWVWSSVLAPSVNYYEWVIQRPHFNNYKHLHKMYQYLQWQNGGKQNRHWVTKNVQHIAYLEELLEFFPNATLVHCHRDPHYSIPSLVKLTIAMWSGIIKDVDPIFTGQAMLKWWQAATKRYLVTRDNLPVENSIIDIPYERIRKDAVNVVQEIYSSAGRPLSAEKLVYPARWDKENEQHKHGKYSYSLEQFGLSTEQIDEEFGEYIRRFIE